MSLWSPQKVSLSPAWTVGTAQCRALDLFAWPHGLSPYACEVSIEQQIHGTPRNISGAYSPHPLSSHSSHLCLPKLGSISSQLWSYHALFGTSSLPNKGIQIETLGREVAHFVHFPSLMKLCTLQKMLLYLSPSPNSPHTVFYLCSVEGYVWL